MTKLLLRIGALEGKVIEMDAQLKKFIGEGKPSKVINLADAQRAEQKKKEEKIRFKGIYKMPDGSDIPVVEEKFSGPVPEWDVAKNNILRNMASVEQATVDVIKGIFEETNNPDDASKKVAEFKNDLLNIVMGGNEAESVVAAHTLADVNSVIDVIERYKKARGS